MWAGYLTLRERHKWRARLPGIRLLDQTTFLFILRAVERERSRGVYRQNRGVKLLLQVTGLPVNTGGAHAP